MKPKGANEQKKATQVLGQKCRYFRIEKGTRLNKFSVVKIGLTYNHVPIHTIHATINLVKIGHYKWTYVHAFAAHRSQTNLLAAYATCA